MDQEDFLLSSYNYELPQDQIAQEPAADQAHDRLMIIERTGSCFHQHDKFFNLGNYLQDNALLVVNNTRVTKCRLKGKRENGGKSEFLLLTPLSSINSITCGKATVNGLLRPAAKSPVGSIVHISDNLYFILEKKHDYGQCTGELRWQGNLQELLETYGSVPLPPYIHRTPDDVDEIRYQTIFAKNHGSAASPTAGLHFSPELKNQLLTRGTRFEEITLHVGYGTFSPVRTNDIRQHKMHTEYVEISPDTAEKITEAKARGNPVIAVGTTVVRALEGAYRSLGRPGPFAGLTDIFLYPGKKFHVIDGIITNFHLPYSTLLMLVSAFAGRKNILTAYREAIASGYRLFSYGDAMFIR